MITSGSCWFIETLRLALAGALGASGLWAQCAAVPKGLAAWFTFDEPMFQALGAHRAERVPGLVGHALRFNGKDQYFEIPGSAAGLNPGEDDFTVELWMRTASKAGTRNIVDKRDNRPVGYLVFAYHGNVGFQVANESVDDVIAKSVNIADNRWHHVAGVVKRLPPRPLAIYVDGAKQPEVSAQNASLANLDVAAPMWLGRHHANQSVPRDDVYFEGEIDELSFYKRALTGEEIRAIYRAGARGKCRAVGGR